MIKVLIGLLPELLKLLWSAYKRYKSGADSKQIKRAMQRINEAFEEPNRAVGADKLSSIWNDSDSD